MISCSVVLASTNPSAVFDNGVFGLASPLPLKNLHGVQTSQLKEQGEEDRWDIYPWKQKIYGDLFFDQVAELESLAPVMDEHSDCKSFSDLHLGEGTSQTLFEDIKDCLPVSPWSGSANSEDKESSDDSLSSDRDYGKASSPIGNKRKKIIKTSPSSPEDCQKSSEPSSSSPEDCEKNLDKRVRNNQASKKFRQLRKGRHKALFDNLQALESENYELNVQMEQMIKEINHLKAVLPEQGTSYMPLLE